MRKASKIDANQPKVVKLLRRLGASVAHTHMVGKGFPDLVVGFLRQTHLVEVKDGDKPPSARKLTPDEERFANEWRGSKVVIVESEKDVEDWLSRIRRAGL